MRIDSYLRISLASAALVFGSLAQTWAQTELIVNGGFEAGVIATGWTRSGGADVYSSGDGAVPHAGSYCLWMGGVASEVDSAYQTITIPSGATSATLSFWYSIYTEETGGTVYDTFS